MNKKDFLDKLNNDDLKPMAIYHENENNIGSLELCFLDNKEKQISKNKFQKTLTYQKNTPNEAGEYTTVDIIAQKKILKSGTVFSIVDAIIY